jgi:hypothetical protein
METHRLAKITLVLFVAFSSHASANTILVINGTASNSLVTPLSNAGFNVVSAAFNPNVISDAVITYNDLSQIWVWNDGTFGNTGSGEVPSRSFSDNDRLALESFNNGRDNWVFDGLSWRDNAAPDEQNFTQNIAANLEDAGGGIVLGADDASGASIVQHVNQVAEWFGFSTFAGTYSTQPASQITGGTFFNTPNAVDPTNIIGTTTYAEVPHGQQGNGIYLSTAIFGEGTQLAPYPSDPLEDDTFNNVLYQNVNHLVTTNLPGAGIDPPPVPIPATWLLLAPALAMISRWRRRVT